MTPLRHPRDAPRKFPNKIAAEKYARLSGFRNAQFIKQKGD